MLSVRPCDAVAGDGGRLCSAGRADFTRHNLYGALANTCVDRDRGKRARERAPGDDGARDGSARARDAVVALLMSSADLLLMNPRTALTPFAHVYKTQCCVVRISRLAPRSRAGFLHDAAASTLAETNSSCLRYRGRWYRPRSVSPDSINPDLSTRRLGRD